MKGNRSVYNKAILNKLIELVNKHPDLRFGQLLVDAGVVQTGELTIKGQKDKIYFIKDCFNEESETTYRRMCGNEFCFPHK